MSSSRNGLRPLMVSLSLFALFALTSHGQQATPRLALEFGAGYDISAGATRTYQTRGWNYRMGGGYNFNHRVGVLAEYSFNDFAIPPAEVNAYFQIPPVFATPQLATGNVHLWSLTLEPIYHVFNREYTGGYIIGGGGFYRKLVAFTAVETGCKGSLQCGTTAPPFYHQSNNTFGANMGIGFTWRPAEGSNAKLFIEGRYTWVDNQPDPRDAFSLASKRTGYFPLTGGIRW